MRLLLVLAALLLVPACANLAEPEPPELAWVAPKLRFAIPGPEALGQAVEADQLVTARYGDEQWVMAGHLSASPERLALVVMDPLGRRALTAIRTPSSATYDTASWVPEQLRAANVLADTVLVYWPADAIRRGFAGSRAEVRDDGSERSIAVDGAEIIHVSYGSSIGGRWRGTAQLRNLALGYSLDFRSEAVMR
jgi:Protein of unknown function (DUF3261)